MNWYKNMHTIYLNLQEIGMNYLLYYILFI
jgi:hypothetical protein